MLVRGKGGAEQAARQRSEMGQGRQMALQDLDPAWFYGPDRHDADRLAPVTQGCEAHRPNAGRLELAAVMAVFPTRDPGLDPRALRRAGEKVAGARRRDDKLPRERGTPRPIRQHLPVLARAQGDDTGEADSVERDQGARHIPGQDPDRLGRIQSGQGSSDRHLQPKLARQHVGEVAPACHIPELGNRVSHLAGLVSDRSHDQLNVQLRAIFPATHQGSGPAVSTGDSGADLRQVAPRQAFPDQGAEMTAAHPFVGEAGQPSHGLVGVGDPAHRIGNHDRLRRLVDRPDDDAALDAHVEHHGCRPQLVRG